METLLSFILPLAITAMYLGFGVAVALTQWALRDSEPTPAFVGAVLLLWPAYMVGDAIIRILGLIAALIYRFFELVGSVAITIAREIEQKGEPPVTKHH